MGGNVIIEGEAGGKVESTNGALNVSANIADVDVIENSLVISNRELYSIFNLMLKELKIINIHLSIATDNEISEWEID
ncbi:MAG: hypothetical protein V3R78_10155 [Thermodesulfobacteriota bacterium]